MQSLSGHLISRAGEEALRLGHRFVGEDHLLLALLRPGEETVAAQVLADCSVTYEALSSALVEEDTESDPPVDEPDYTDWISTNASAHELLGRAEGLAAGLGADGVSAEHVLLAFLWPPENQWVFERCGTTRQAVYVRLKEQNVPVPATELPPSPERPVGESQRVFFPKERLSDVLAALPSLLPPDVEWGWNLDGHFRAWVDAVGDFDLQERVREALSKRAS